MVIHGNSTLVFSSLAAKFMSPRPKSGTMTNHFFYEDPSGSCPTYHPTNHFYFFRHSPLYLIHCVFGILLLKNDIIKMCS